MGYRKLGKIIGLATNITDKSSDFTFLIYRSGSFQEINVRDGVITNKELEREDYISRLEELKNDPNYAYSGNPYLAHRGKYDLPASAFKERGELIKSNLPEEKPFKRAVGFDLTGE